MKKIHVGISLTDGDNMTWEEGTRPCSRMLTHGWTDEDELEQPLNSHANKERWGTGGYGWAAQTEVKDLEEGQSLSDTLFVVICCSGAYQKQGTLRWSYGSTHGSWGVQCGFVNQQKAEAFVKTETKKWLWLWIFEVQRFRPAAKE